MDHLVLQLTRAPEEMGSSSKGVGDRNEDDSSEGGSSDGDSSESGSSEGDSSEDGISEGSSSEGGSSEDDRSEGNVTTSTYLYGEEYSSQCHCRSPGCRRKGVHHWLSIISNTHYAVMPHT